MQTCLRGHHRDDSVKFCAECRRFRYESRKGIENESNRQWIKKNGERYKAKQREYRESNPEKISEVYAEWAKKHPVHSIWRGMKHRCYSPKNVHYASYGGRGITVCDRWLGNNGYKNFEADMGPRLSAKHTIERKNNDGNYEPGNCVWASRKKQQRNRRGNHLLTIGGITKCMTEWAEENGLIFNTLQKRIRKGWPESMWLIPANQNYRNIGNTGRRKSVA